MKKLVFAAVAAAAMTGLCVESGVVGYANKSTPQNAFRIVGLPFNGVDNVARLNDVFKMETTISSEDDFMNDAPQIQVMNAQGGYETYYYITDAVYYVDPTDPESDVGTKAGWADYSGVLCTPEMYASDPDSPVCENPGLIAAGSSAWIKDPSKACAMTESGAVYNRNIGVDCLSKFVIRANPFPTSFELNNPNQVIFSDMPEITSEDDFMNDAPQIQIMNDAGGYETYYYITDAVFYVDPTDPESDVDTGAGWVDYTGVLCTPAMYAMDPDSPVCENPGVCTTMNGLWVKGVSKAFSMTFINPVK